MASSPSSLRTALVFAGQGSQRKGMASPLLEVARTPAWRSWIAMSQALQDETGIDLTTVVRDDPPSATCRGTLYRAGRRGAGVLSNTVFTQPALLAFQLAALEQFKVSQPKAEFACVAGHSLGEFTALAALGVLEPTAAVKLVCRRGEIMTEAIRPLTTRRRSDDPIVFPMYAVNPTRADLKAAAPSAAPADAAAAEPTDAEAPTTPDDIVLEILDLIAQSGTVGEEVPMLELANHNIRGEQLVVGGDRTSLSALGKCLDPQWRATIAEELKLTGGVMSVEDLVAAAVAESAEDAKLGVSRDPNAVFEKDLSWVPGSRRRSARGSLVIQQHATIDGDATKPVVQTLAGSRQGDGRSGLVKRSWFMPLELSVPFHTSALRRGLDPLFDEMLKALPNADVVADRLSATSGRPRWITNVTATPFDAAPGSVFRADALSALNGMNIGEQAQTGRHVPTRIPDLQRAVTEGDARELVAAVCAMQLCRTVQWAGSMDSIAMPGGQMGCERVLEVTPTPTLGAMFRKAGLTAPAGGAGEGVKTFGYCPADTTKGIASWKW